MPCASIRNRLSNHTFEDRRIAMWCQEKRHFNARSNSIPAAPQKATLKGEENEFVGPGE